MLKTIARLLKTTEHHRYPNEYGKEPYETCHTLWERLRQSLKSQSKISTKEFLVMMSELENSWKDVVIARHQERGRVITRAWVESSEECDELVSYLDTLGKMGVYSPKKLDRLYAETIQNALKEGYDE